MLILDWNHKLKVDRVKVWCVGPRLLATDSENVLEAKHPSVGG